MIEGSIPLFVNPTAGGGRAARVLPALTELLTANGIAHTVIESRGQGDLEVRVAEAVKSGAARLLLAGGDGSVHEAVNGILAGGGQAELGVVPVGTGNDFAKACTIPLHWEDAAVLLVDRLKSELPARAIDVGRMNGRYFANGAGIGFDARVTAISRNIRLPIGDLVYLLAVLGALAGRLTTPELRLRCGDLVIDGPVTLVNISNGSWVGGMFRIAPQAVNDDGDLDLVVVKPVGRLRIVRLLPKLMDGKHLDEPELSCHRITACEIVATSPVPSHLDGELQPAQMHFDVEVVPGALPLL